MKQILYISIILITVACNHSAKKRDSDHFRINEYSVDTVLVKIENTIDVSLTNFYSKSYTYHWISEKDTLDFRVGLKEYVRDSTISIRFYHNEPILFSDALDKLNDCLPLIEQDFEMNKLKSLYLKPPIFYKDLTTELSKNYEHQFGNKNIKYQKLNEFLMKSWLEKKVSGFLKQLDKTTGRYGIEKFHLLKKEYYDGYIPNTDLKDYPSFSIHGMGVSVILNENK